GRAQRFTHGALPNGRANAWSRQPTHHQTLTSEFPLLILKSKGELNMHPRIEEVINYLDGERAALRDAVERVPAELRDKQPGSDRWSVAQVLEHLGIIEKRVGLGLTKWVSEARGALGPEADTSSVMNSLPRQLIVDRSRRRNAPEEVRPPGKIV